MDIIKQIKKFKPYNEQEKHDKIGILKYLEKEKNIFTRDNKIAHMTASAWVVNKGRNKVVMIYHNIYNSWSWMGGHADGEEDLFAVATKEVREESGLNNIIPISKDIFSLEILTVDGHIKKGEYISSHLHLNITYLFEANENADDGDFYIKNYILLEGHELNDEIRNKQAEKTFELCLGFLNDYDNLVPIKQSGTITHYSKRTPKDSELDINKSIKEQFDLFRIVNNDEYPAFFEYNGCKYIVKIYKERSPKDDDCFKK